MLSSQDLSSGKKLHSLWGAAETPQSKSPPPRPLFFPLRIQSSQITFSCNFLIRQTGIDTHFGSSKSIRPISY